MRWSPYLLALASGCCCASGCGTKLVPKITPVSASNVQPPAIPWCMCSQASRSEGAKAYMRIATLVHKLWVRLYPGHAGNGACSCS